MKTTNSRLLVLTLSAVTSILGQNVNNSDNAIAVKQQTHQQNLPGTRLTAAQQEALRAYGSDVNIAFSDQEVPSYLMGRLSARAFPDDPVAEAQAVLLQHGPAFRRRVNDNFVFNALDTEKNGDLSVRMTQNYKGIPVSDAELVVYLNRDSVTGITGRFVPDLDVQIDSTGNSAEVDAERKPIILVDGNGIGHLAFTTQVTNNNAERNNQEKVFIDANDGRVLGRQMLSVVPAASMGNGLRNPGFESGSNGDWSESHAVCGSPGDPTPWIDCLLINPSQIIMTGCGAFGNYCAWLNGWGEKNVDQISQSVRVPSLAFTGALNFLLRISTTERTSSQMYDKLTVEIRSAAGTAVTPAKLLSNLDATTYSSYQYVSIPPFDLSRFRGQTITVSFRGEEDYSNKTSFYLDNVLLTFTTF